MRGICGEPALSGEPLFEPVERTINRDDQRQCFGWHICLRQADRDESRADSAGLCRYRPQRPQAPANAIGGEQQSNYHEWRHLPRDIEHEFPQDRMNQLVAARNLGHQHRERPRCAVESHADA